MTDKIKFLDCEGVEILLSGIKEAYSKNNTSDYGAFEVAHANKADELTTELPSADGTYVLQVTISDGVPTYSWVSAQ